MYKVQDVTMVFSTVTSRSRELVYSRSEDGESFESYYGNNRYSASYGDEMYSRGRPRERFAGRGTFKSYDNRGGFHGRAKIVDQSSQEEFEKPKLHHSPAHSTSHSGSRNSSKNKKKRVSRSGSHTSSSSSSSGSTSSCASRSSSRSSSRCSTTRSNALPSTTTLVKSYRTESQESNNSDKTGANDDDKRPRGICINHLPLRSTDTSLRDGLFHEYKKYGKVNAVLVAGVGDERYAIVSFRKPEDAAKALSASHDKVFFGSKIKVATHEGIEVDDNEFRPPEAELDEHHPKATRTLFVGNLEKDISNQELRERFLKFGEILDIDVKRQGAVSAYAFVQFTDIRSVVKVLKEMEGEVWGSMKLKLGFGKSMPTNCVWLDNVDQTVQENFLSRQFGRYGQVTHGIIDRIKGKGLVYFTNAEQAQYALVEMRNRILNNKKIMIDFASRDCQVEFYEQMEKNGQLKPGLRPDERRGWLYNRQAPEGQWEASYDNRTANFSKFTSPGTFRGPQRGSRVAGRGAGRYKEEFSEEFKRTRSYEDYRYPGESDDFEQDLRAYQRERQHGSQSPPPYGEEMYNDPAYQRSKDFYKYAESYRSGSPHSERQYEGFEFDKIRVDEKYYGKERYIVRERSPDVQFNRSWSRSPTHGGQMATKEAVGRNTPPTPMDDEARDFSRDVSPVEEGQSKYGESKSKRRSEDDFNICEADIAELKGRSKYPGVFHKDTPSWPEEKYERKRSYEESFSQDYMKSPRKQNRLFSSKSSIDRIESSKRDLYQKYQIIQSRITEKLKGRNESSPSSASSGSEPGQLNEGELSNLQHEKNLLLEKLKQLDKESSTSDIEEAFDMDDPRKIPSKRARLEPMGAWGEPPPQPQMELGNVSNKYDYRGKDSTIVRKQTDSIHNFDEKERSKSCTRSSMDESDHEEFTSLLSPKDAHIGFIKKRKKSEHSEENNRSFRSKHGEEDPHMGSDNDEFRNISRLDQLSSNPVFRRLSSNDSSNRASYYPHESYSELHRHDMDVASSEGISASHSEENKHKRSDSTNKSHSHRSKHRHKEDHQPTKIPLEEDFSNTENVDPRNPHRLRQSLSLPLPKFARLDANVMTSPDVIDSPVISKADSPRFSSPSSGSKNTSSPQRSPSESNSTNSQENPQQDYIPEENPANDMNNDAAALEVLGEKGEFDSDGSSEHSDHNDSFEMDKISLEERIRRLDEKLNAVPVPKSSTKLTSEISSLPTNTPVTKSDNVVSSLSRTALYSKFKINKKEATPGTGADVKTGESTEIAKKVTSRFSIFDQDTKRLQDKIHENSSPKSTPNFDENLANSSPMTPLRTKGAVKEMPAQMPHLATLPGSLAGRLGNGAAPFPTLTATTTSSNSSRPEETNAVDVFSVNPAVVSGAHERQWQLESSSLKTSIKPWQKDSSSSLSKNSSPDQISGKDIATGHFSEDSTYKPLITPAFRKQMSDTFSKTDEKSSPKHPPLELRNSPSPPLENKAQTSGFDSPKSEIKLLDSAGQKSDSVEPIKDDSSEIASTGKEISSDIESKSEKLSQESKMDISQEEQSIKRDVESLDVSEPMVLKESISVDKKNNDTLEALKPKSSPPVVLTKAEVKDMSPVNLLKQISGSKDKSSNGAKDTQKKHSHESSEDSNSSVMSGKRKADTEEKTKAEKEKSKDSTSDHKSVCNTSDSESMDIEKSVQAKKPKIHKSESQSSDMLSEKMEKSNSSAKAKDSQKKDKNKDSKKKEKCEGDSTKKDKNHHERKDKDKDGGRDKGTSSSSSKSLSVSSSNVSKAENDKNSKTDDKKAKSSKSEERKSEKSNKTVGSSKTSDDKTKSNELTEKNSKATNEKKASSSENKKDSEKVKKVSDHAGHRKESKSSTSSKPSSDKPKDKSKDKSNVKSKESVRSEKNAKDGVNDKSNTKTKVEEKAVEKSSKTENSITEKSKEVSEEKQKNAVTNDTNNTKNSKSDSENKGNSSQNSESSEKGKEKSNSLDLGSAPNDHMKDSKNKGKHSSNEKSMKPKQKDETRIKSKEKHSSEKSKDKVSKESKSSSKKEESKLESSKDNTEKKTDSKTEQMESKTKHDNSEKSEDKKSESNDKKVSPKDGHSDSKKKQHESSKPSDKLHKSHKKKSSSSSVSDDVTSNDSSKNSKTSEKLKPSKTEHKSKNDSDKIVKKETKVSKSEEDKKKPSKPTTEKKKSSKENRPSKSVTPKKKEKKEEKIEEHKSSDVAKKADDDFDWDAWKEESMYDKVKRRSTYKDKEREMEQNRQKQLDQLQERRQKKSKSGSILQSDISSTNYSDSDDLEPSKKTFNKRKSKSKKIYSSSDSDSDFHSSIYPPEKKLQPQKPKLDPSKKSKKQSLLGDIYSSDSDDSTDSSFSNIRETIKKVKQVKKVASFESDDMFQSKSKKGSKKVQENSKPKSNSLKKQNIFSIYSSSDDSDDSDSELDFKKFSCAKENNIQRFEKKSTSQKSAGRIYSSSDSDSMEENHVIPVPKPISLSSKTPKTKTKEKQKISESIAKKICANDSNPIEEKIMASNDTSKSTVISQTVLEKECLDSVLDSVEKTDKSKKDKLLTKKNKKKEKENILVGEGKLEIGKNHQYGLFEKIETMITQSNTKSKKVPVESRAVSDGGKKLMKDSTEIGERQKDNNKKKKPDSIKEKEPIKKTPELISPVLSPVTEFSDSLHVDNVKNYDGSVIVDEIPLEEDSFLMDAPCGAENDNARGMWDSIDDVDKMSKSLAIDDSHLSSPEKSSMDSDVARDPSLKKSKKKKVDKEGEAAKKTKKTAKLEKDIGKPKKKKNKNKTCSEVDKTIDDVSKGKDILLSDHSDRNNPEFKKMDGMVTDFSDVDLDFTTPLFGNFVPEKIKPNRPSAKDKSENEFGKNEMSEDREKEDALLDTVPSKETENDEQGPEPELAKTESKAHENKVESLNQQISETSKVTQVKHPETPSKSTKQSNKNASKEMNPSKLSEHSISTEGKESMSTSTPTKPVLGKGSDGGSQKNSADVFDFKEEEEEEEVLDKMKPRHNAERESSQKSKKSDSAKIPFKWDISDITSKETKPSFESKMTNKMVNHKQESLFASWAKSLAENSDKDQSVSVSKENTINKLNKKSITSKKQPKVSTEERTDPGKEDKNQSAVPSVLQDRVKDIVDENKIAAENVAVGKCAKEIPESSKKLDEDNIEIAVSTIQDLQNEEKRERESDVFADEGTLVIDETNSCISEAITERPADQEPPPADSETALAIQSILGLEPEDATNKLPDYTEPEPLVDSSEPDNQLEEEKIAAPELIEEPHAVHSDIPVVNQEASLNQVLPPAENYCPNAMDQVPGAQMLSPTKEHIDNVAVPSFEDLKQKLPKGKKQKQAKAFSQMSDGYQQVMSEDYLQDTQNKEDSDDGALHIATDVLPVSPREEQPTIAHQMLETREETLPQEFEVPSVKKPKSRRKTNGKGMDEPNLVPEQKQPCVFEPPVSALAPVRQEAEADLDAGLDITGFGSPPLASNKGEDRDISMSDYTDSERNDDNEFGGEESKRPQRGGGRRKNYKKLSGISPRTNSPRSRTSPRSPRVASPKQLSPKSDIASPVVKIERLPLANKSLKLDEEPSPPKDIQTSPAPSTTIKENVSVKDAGMRRGRSSGSAVELTQKTINVYDFDEVESEEQNTPIPKRRSSSRKKKSCEETFDSKDTGKVLKSEIMDTGIKMTIRPTSTVRQSKENIKEKGNDFPRLNEIQVAHAAEPVQREVSPYPVEEKKAMKPRDIMSAEHRTRALLIGKETPKVPLVSEQPMIVPPQQSMPPLMSNVDRIIDNVSKGYFDTGEKTELTLPPQANHFTTPITVDVGAYERKRTSSRGSCAEESILKSPSMKSPSMKSPQMTGTSPAFHLGKSPAANTISPVNPMFQNRMNPLINAYPGHIADLQNRDPMSLHMMSSTPTASSSPISTQSSVICTMANKMDMHVTMTVPQLTSSNSRIPAHMSCTLSNPVVTEREIGMNLTKSANESFPTTVLNTVSSTGVGRSVIANAHTHLSQSKHLTSVDMSAQHPEASNPTVKPNMPIVSAPKKQNVSPHLSSRNTPSSEKPNIPLPVALGERQQQSMSSAPTCVVHPITTTSLSRQPHNMPTMIQPPSGGDRFFPEMKIREDVTKEQLKHLQYLQLMQDMQQQHHAAAAAAKLNKTGQKQQDLSKELTQRPPSAHSNQQKQSLTGEAHARLLQEQQQQQQQQAFLAMQQEIQSKLLHSQQGFFPASFWHPHLQPPGVKMDDKKPDGKTSSPNSGQQQHNVIAASSQHPQIKSPALAQTAPNMHQIGLSNNTSPPNSGNKKALEKTNTTLRWGSDLVVSAHEGTKMQLPSHDARATPREHWAQPGMHPKLGPKPAHQQTEINPPMSQKEHIKKKRAEERKQQELEELHLQRQRELQFKQMQMEQAAHRKPSGSTSNQPTDMRQTAHVPGQQRPDGQLENKNLMEAHFIQHPMYPGISDMRRPPSHNPSAFTPPISGSDISQAMPAHKNYAEIQQQYQQHLYNVPLDHLLQPRLPSHYMPRPGLPIQDLTEAGPTGRSRSPPHVQNNPGTPQTSKHREQGEQLARMQHENPLHMPPRAIPEGPAPGGEGSLLSLLQRYPVMWQGVLALKNDQCVVQLHMINGFEQLVKLSLPQQGPDGSVQPLRIAQRMRLEAAQLDGVIKRMKFDNDYCMLLALPCGRDHDHIIEQTRAMTTGFIQYLQQKQAAGIVNVAEPETQQPAYVVHIFPPCDFSRTTLERLGFGLMQPLRDLAHLLVIITTVA
uniref:Msx2-interacting protein-like isoform X3 n=1 Tax=Crassostrea virginica TaxID=6565 RepID=A0A8B8EH42_CRAVI|nr:msx2-interacting protein-like isoform X3 [Crassostrea virginica]